MIRRGTDDVLLHYTFETIRRTLVEKEGRHRQLCVRLSLVGPTTSPLLLYNYNSRLFLSSPSYEFALRVFYFFDFADLRETRRARLSLR